MPKHREGDLIGKTNSIIATPSSVKAKLAIFLAKLQNIIETYKKKYLFCASHIFLYLCKEQSL